MKKPSDLRVWLPAVVGLAALLLLVAGLQESWIGRWSEVEDARLRTDLAAGAEAFDADLGARLIETAAAWIEVTASDATAGDSLSARQNAMPASALPIAAVYWVTPGPQPSLLELDATNGTLRPALWEDVGLPWREAFTRWPASARTEGPVEIDTRGMPGSPPALAFPALPPATSPDIPIRFVLIRLDAEALRSETFPGLAAEHLPLPDAFDVVVRGGTGSGAALYSSRPGLSSLPSPDLARAVGQTIFSSVTLSQRSTGSVRTIELDGGALTAGDAPWRLQVRHRAGSIGAAVAGLRWRQRALAMLVLAVLAVATALLVRFSVAQRRLAERQMAFVAGVSHELRTPLAVIGSAAENLADGVVSAPEQVREYGGLVRDESRRLAEMVEAVLALGGVDAQTAPRTDTPVADLIETGIGQAAPALEAVTLKVDVADALPRVEVDAAAVAAAIRNLLVNAARHGGPTVTIGARSISLAGGPGIEISVVDDGDGPGDVELDALFEPFVRGGSVVGTPGSGLGLALVRRVADSHGGSARLQRTPEGLTRAALTLPAIP